MEEWDDYQLFWKEALNRMRKEKGEQEFATWFNMEYLKAEENRITLGVPSSFYKDQVRHRYQDYIESVIRDLAGKEIAIALEVKPRKISEFAGFSANSEKNVLRDAGPARKNPESPAKKETHLRLNKDYSFDTYVIGEDRFPGNAAMAVAKNPGTTSYNPLLIYGGTGLGKTHLMQAIGNYIYDNSENKVIYITAEDFTNEFIQALNERGERGIAAFKSKYRNTDILLIDDIHFFEKKDGTQEELFHTFNALYMAKKQMVFTCDRPVHELKNFTERLKSRFEQGLNLDIKPPNYETRFAILKKKCEIWKKTVADDVLELISRHISSNVRDLEGALNKLIAYMDLVGRPITLEIAQQQLKDVISGPKQANLSIEMIIKVVADYFNLSHIDLKNKKRSQNIVFPRQLAMYITRDITEFSTTEIGQSFGGRDHTTVMHACQKIEERKKADPTLDSTIQTLTRMIKEAGAKA
ncbi:MAG: chromosomal replication initiator protein DnaA [Spirochaetaceae bacterium]|jgi:chromosomal replication initiator protein|nr:chromosomal replication initiator protein DnaA [Spirochaetaceae bacterium]